MIRHHEIRRAGKRAVKVERRCAARAEMVRRGIEARIAANDAAAADRDRLRELGVSIVADALGLAHMLELGGVMTAERGRALDGRKVRTCEIAQTGKLTGMLVSGASDPVAKIDMRPPIVIPAPGLLRADIGRHIHPARGVFGSALWLGGTL